MQKFMRERGWTLNNTPIEEDPSIDSMYDGIDAEIQELVGRFGKRWVDIIAKRLGLDPNEYTPKEIAYLSGSNSMSRKSQIEKVMEYRRRHPEVVQNNALNCNFNMNKKLIRLTESDLHRIVKESVNRILNEIGDTPKGQLALGAVAGRANVRGNRNTEIAASNKAWDNSASGKVRGTHYDSGYELGRDMEHDKQLKQHLASRLKESRFSKYKYANNPLFSKDEAEYWDTLEYPNDEEYNRILQLAKQVDYNTLYKKLGHDKFNSFMCRLEEDDPDFHERYTAINRDELPF